MPTAQVSVMSKTRRYAADVMRVEVVVIGAGQAGLAIGYHLARQGRRFVIVDGADSIGSAWRSRWDSLVLFTPRRYSGLPGLPFPGDPDGYPGRDEVIAYLEQYAVTFGLPDPARQRGALVDIEGRRVCRRPRRQADRSRSGRCRNGPLSGATGAGVRRRPRAGGVPGAQHRLPEARGRTRGSCSCRRWRKHGLSDRKGARRNPDGSSRGGLAAEAAATTIPWPRHLLVADEDRADQQEPRLTDRASGEPTGHPPRLKSPRSSDASGSN